MRFHYRQMSIINDWLNNYLLASHQLSKQLKFPPVKLKHMIVDFYENQKKSQLSVLQYDPKTRWEWQRLSKRQSVWEKGGLAKIHQPSICLSVIRKRRFPKIRCHLQEPKQIHRFTKSTSIMFHRTVQQDNRHKVIRFMETVNYWAQ